MQYCATVNFEKLSFAQQLHGRLVGLCTGIDSKTYKSNRNRASFCTEIFSPETIPNLIPHVNASMKIRFKEVILTVKSVKRLDENSLFPLV